VHPTLWLLFIAWFPLIVRGIFGILQAAVFSVRLRHSFTVYPKADFLFRNQLSYYNRRFFPASLYLTLKLLFPADNYSATGFTPRFTAIEYFLGVLTEWIACVLRPFAFLLLPSFTYTCVSDYPSTRSCVLLNLTYLTSRHDPKKRDVAIDAPGSNEALGVSEQKGSLVREMDKEGQIESQNQTERGSE
jgi:hypothetical protein